MLPPARGRAAASTKVEHPILMLRSLNAVCKGLTPGVSGSPIQLFGCIPLLAVYLYLSATKAMIHKLRDSNSNPCTGET